MTYTIRDNNGNEIFSIESVNKFKNKKPSIDVPGLKRDLKNILNTINKVHSISIFSMKNNNNKYKLIIIEFELDNYSFEKSKLAINNYFRKTKHKISEINDIDYKDENNNIIRKAVCFDLI